MEWVFDGLREEPFQQTTNCSGEINQAPARSRNEVMEIRLRLKIFGPDNEVGFFVGLPLSVR